MPKVKNQSNPVYIGKKLCNTGAETEISQKDLELFLSTKFGSSLYNVTLFVIDPLKEGKDVKKFDALKVKAMAECRQTLGPIIEKEITEKLEKEYQEEIKGLHGKIEELEKIISDMVIAGKPDDGKKTKDIPKVTDEKNKIKDEKEFVFNPEIHHVEHRGAGKWFAMEKEEKIHGPLTEEEKKQYDEIITGSI